MWEIVQVIATVALTTVVFGIWRPWGKGYAEEKGKLLARQEDLEAILAEIKAITLAQKGIEARLATSVWSYQNHVE